MVLALIGFLVFSNIKISRRRAALRARIEYLKAEIKTLENKNRQIKENIAKGGSEKYLEKVAREQLGLKKEGEEVVVVKKEKI